MFESSNRGLERKGEPYADEISCRRGRPVFAPRNHCSCLRTARATGKGAGQTTTGATTSAGETRTATASGGETGTATASGQTATGTAAGETRTATTAGMQTYATTAK